ncbi:MAG: motility-associated protein, partial [Pannonibacter indicus]
MLGLIIAMASLLGGFYAMGGKVLVLWQPFEVLIIVGVAIGTFFVANPMKTIKDTMRAVQEAVLNSVPKKRDYLDILA